MTFENRLIFSRHKHRDTDMGGPAPESLRPEGLLNVRGANIQAAGLHNRRIVLRALRGLGRAERRDLANLTGLTTPAIYKIVKDLGEEGLVVNAGSREGAKGQPAAVLTLNPDAAFSIGVSLERDVLSFVGLDFAGHIRTRRSFTTGHADQPPPVRIFADCLGAFRSQGKADLSKVAGIGISSGTHTPAVTAEALGTALSALVAAPVHMTGAAGAAAHAEALLGCGSGQPSFLYIHLGDDLSCLPVIGQQCIRSGDQEILGILPQLNPFRSSRTDLGKTLGETASISGFLQVVAGNRPVIDLANLDLSDSGISAGAEDWMGSVADLLYVPLLAIICALNPTSVYVGGPLPSAINERLCYAIAKRLSLTLGSQRTGTAVRSASLGQWAPAVGAALTAFNPKWETGR